MNYSMNEREWIEIINELSEKVSSIESIEVTDEVFETLSLITATSMAIVESFHNGDIPQDFKVKCYRQMGLELEKLFKR